MIKLLERIRTIISMTEGHPDYKAAINLIRRAFEQEGYPIHKAILRPGLAGVTLQEVHHEQTEREKGVEDSAEPSTPT